MDTGRIKVNVVIVANLGGWGNVALEKSDDILPTIQAVQAYFETCGLSSKVVIYRRAPAKPPATTPKSDVEWRILTEMFGFHHTGSRQFAKKMESLATNNPEVQFILIGISNGATFIDQTMQFISPAIANQVIAIEVGVPFWRGIYNSENILRFDNEGADPLTRGEMDILVATLVKGAFNLFRKFLAGRSARWNQVWQIPEHGYSWERIGPTVRAFLNRHLIQQNQSGNY